MEKFWAVILIFVIVAAGGLLYVNQVYNPQKETQMAMAEVANETLSAVKAEIENGAGSREVSAEEVISEVEELCGPGNEVSITVKTSDNLSKVYKEDKDNIGTRLSAITNQFSRVAYYKDGVLDSITFTEISG